MKLRSGLLAGAILCLTQAGEAAQLRSLTIEDCIRTRRIVQEEVQISRDGTLAAYVVKAPDTVTNRNNYQLYLRDLRQTARRENGRLLLQADKISGVKWLDRGRIIAQTERIEQEGREAGSAAIILNISAGTQEVLSFPRKPESYGNNGSYSISDDGNTVVFSAKTAEEASPSALTAEKLQQREARGYRIAFGDGSGTEVAGIRDNYEVYLGKRSSAADKFTFTKLQFVGPEAPSLRNTLRDVRGLQLSPDGRFMLIRYRTEKLPPDMAGDPLIQLINSNGTTAASRILAVYDIDTGRLRLDFHYPEYNLQTRWSADSRAYAVTGPYPLDSEQGRAESAAAMASNNRLLYSYRFAHVFAIDAGTGAMTTVLKRDTGQGGVTFWHDLPLEWERDNGEMWVRADQGNLAQLKLRGGQWRITSRFEFRRQGVFDDFPSSDGRVLLGVSQASKIPPDLVLLKIGTQKRILLTDFNPQFRHIALGQMEKIEWVNRYGSHCKGRLIKPTGYSAGTRYPLIIMASDFDEDYFISDSLYTTAFAPQSLANAGFLVLMSKYTVGDKIPREQFPGDMGMAYDWMSMVESAVDLLMQQGLADRNNVGIVGFSRTSWLTDFTLTHSDYKFTAASSADGGLYTYGGYYFFNDLRGMRSDDTQLGGPPYGKTLTNWLQYTAPFNADKVRAPVLLEWTGPLEPVFEFFGALARQEKPVELYHYPKGGHPLDTPFERLASLHRNVDWFRFWMQGYEGKAPDYDPDQYVRWRKLREQQEWNERMRGEGKDPSAEFLRQTSPGATVSDADRAPAAAEFAQ